MMGFLPYSEAQGVDQHLLQDLWKLMRAEKYDGVTVENLKTFMLNVIGIRVANREGIPEGEHDDKHETESHKEEGDEHQPQ
jgi:hypothetical protein